MDTRIEVHGRDEIGQLAEAFNHMTQRWRRRGSAWCKPSVLPRARTGAASRARVAQPPLSHADHGRKFAESPQLDAKHSGSLPRSTATLKAELANLNTIVGRFSDFFKMPAPQFVRVNVNEALRNAVRLFEPQSTKSASPPSRRKLFLTEPLPDIDADPTCSIARFRIWC